MEWVLRMKDREQGERWDAARIQGHQGLRLVLAVAAVPVQDASLLFAVEAEGVSDVGRKPELMICQATENF